MQNVDRFSRKSHDVGFRVCNSPVVDIHVPSDRGNRGDAAQRVYNFGTSNVATARRRSRPSRPQPSHDLSAELASVGDRDNSFPLPHGRGDEFHHGSPGIDPRSLPPKAPKPRDIYVPDLHIDSIKVKTRDFK